MAGVVALHASARSGRASAAMPACPPSQPSPARLACPQQSGEQRHGLVLVDEGSQDDHAGGPAQGGEERHLHNMRGKQYGQVHWGVGGRWGMVCVGGWGGVGVGWGGGGVGWGRGGRGARRAGACAGCRRRRRPCHHRSLLWLAASPASMASMHGWQACTRLQAVGPGGVVRHVADVCTGGVRLQSNWDSQRAVSRRRAGKDEQSLFLCRPTRQAPALRQTAEHTLIDSYYSSQLYMR